LLVAESAAGEVVTEFKATADYAGLYGPDMILDKSDPAADEDDSDAQDERHEDRGGGRTKGLKLMDGERIVFTEENSPQTYVKLIASGDVDDSLLEALEDYVKRQRKRIQKEAAN
jgi:hypothetical protein